MSFLQVKNNASSVLAADITDVATSLTVATGEGAKFPASNFHITIENEILLCSTRTGDVLTVTRAQEGTSAAAHTAGKTVRLNITAAIVTELQNLLTEKSCGVNRSTDQSIPNGAWTSISYDTEEWDTDNIHDNVTNNSRLTCQTPGRYLIYTSLRFLEVATGARLARIIKNGTTVVALAYIGKDADNRFAIAITTVVNLVANDYIETQAYQSSGASLNIIGATGEGGTRLGMIRMPFPL